MTAILMHCVPKLAIVHQHEGKVLLCRRANETDLNGVFTFIGGKMELADADIVETLRRERDEEIGPDVRLRLLHTYSIITEYRRLDGLRQILPHYLAFYVGGRIALSSEYSEAIWVHIRHLDGWEAPMIRNIPGVLQGLMALRSIADENLDYTLI